MTGLPTEAAGLEMEVPGPLAPLLAKPKIRVKLDSPALYSPARRESTVAICESRLVAAAPSKSPVFPERRMWRPSPEPLKVCYGCFADRSQRPGLRSQDSLSPVVWQEHCELVQGQAAPRCAGWKHPVEVRSPRPFVPALPTGHPTAQNSLQ